jgi:hypothetical protein
MSKTQDTRIIKWPEGYELPGIQGDLFRGRPPLLLDIAKDLSHTTTIALIGKRNSGKTSAMLHLLSNKKFLRNMVMCPSPAAFKSFGRYFPKPYIHSSFDEKVLSELLKSQKKIALSIEKEIELESLTLFRQAKIEEQKRTQHRISALKKLAEIDHWSKDKEDKEMKELLKKDDEEIRMEGQLRKRILEELRNVKTFPHVVALILDDCSSEKKIMLHKILKTIMNNGRHYLLFFIVSVQYGMDFPAALRGGLDWVFIYNDVNMKNLKKLTEHFVGVFESEYALRSMLDYIMAVNEKLTGRYILMVSTVCKDADPYKHIRLCYCPPESEYIETQLGDPIGNWLANIMFDPERFENDGELASDPTPATKRKETSSAKNKKKTQIVLEKENVTETVPSSSGSYQESLTEQAKKKHRKVKQKAAPQLSQALHELEREDNSDDLA